ncbi:MAG: ArsR/SmtB family transcription factor [Steroidobacteraceae bacterium]
MQKAAGDRWRKTIELFPIATFLECRQKFRAPYERQIDIACYFRHFGTMKSNDAVATLAALAQDSRLALFRLLVKRGPEGYTPGEIMGRLDIPAPTLSFHLKTLSTAGLIDSRREGRRLFYSANFDTMNGILGFLTDHCCSLATDCSTANCTPNAKPASRRKSA